MRFTWVAVGGHQHACAGGVVPGSGGRADVMAYGVQRGVLGYLGLLVDHDAAGVRVETKVAAVIIESLARVLAL